MCEEGEPVVGGVVVVPLVARGVHEDHCVWEVLVVVDDEGQVDHDFAAFVGRDGERGGGGVDGVYIVFPSGEGMGDPGCVVSEEGGYDESAAARRGGSIVVVVQEEDGGCAGEEEHEKPAGEAGTGVGGRHGEGRSRQDYWC